MIRAVSDVVKQVRRSLPAPTPPRAEALAAIVRSAGVASAYAERSGDGDDDRGALQILFGRDAER